MSKLVLLNNVDHEKLRVKTGYSAEFGDCVNQVLVFPTEFGDIQREYPILIQKNKETREYQAVALLGLDKNENLYIENGAWSAEYVPAVIDRGPFSIGMQKKLIDGENVREPMVQIDLDNPRVNEVDGERIFLEHGGNSPYFNRITKLLKRIFDGLAVNKSMFSRLEELELLEPMKLEIKLSETEQYNIEGYYTISEEKFLNLDGESLLSLNKTGYIRGIIFIMSSLHNISKLIEKKNCKRLQR